jgi:hypothetical protein
VAICPVKANPVPARIPSRGADCAGDSLGGGRDTERQ